MCDNLLCLQRAKPRKPKERLYKITPKVIKEFATNVLLKGEAKEDSNDSGPNGGNKGKNPLFWSQHNHTI